MVYMVEGDWLYAKPNENPPRGYIEAAQKDYGLIWVRADYVVTLECGPGYCCREVRRAV